MTRLTALLGKSVSGAVLIALLAVSPAAASARAPSSTVRAADTKGWCNAVIQTNTKYGTMKNKRFLAPGEVPMSAWKKVVDAAVAGHDRYLALAPSEIKTAVKHQLAWFARVKRNKYALSTPLAPLTIADIHRITNFERTKCGIKFGS